MLTPYPLKVGEYLAKAVGGEEKLEPANYLIRQLREVKDEGEIKLIREACKMADAGHESRSRNHTLQV